MFRRARIGYKWNLTGKRVTFFETILVSKKATEGSESRCWQRLMI